MPDFNVRFNLSPEAVSRAMTEQMRGETGLLERGVRRAAGKVRDQTKRNITAKARVNNGRMRQSVDYRILPGDHRYRVTAEVGIYVVYARFQEEGTASAGTGFIYPRNAKVLRFKAKGGSKFIFARKVRGVKPGHFLKDAVASLTSEDFKVE